MEQAKKNRNAYQSKWKAEHTVLYQLRLQKSTDADIIDYLEGKPSRQGEIKRLMRIAMAMEKEQEQK